jgi:hypothetical protein
MLNRIRFGVSTDIRVPCAQAHDSILLASPILVSQFPITKTMPATSDVILQIKICSRLVDKGNSPIE